MSKHVLFDLFIPALTAVIDLETAHYRDLDKRKAAKQPPPTAEDVKPFREALENLAEQLKPMMLSVLGPTDVPKTQADLEAMSSPIALIEKLPAEFLWLAFTKYLARCRDELLRVENPPSASMGGFLAGSGMADLIDALKAGGADISLKILSQQDIEEKGIRDALKDAPDLLDKDEDEDEDEGAKG